MILQLINIHTRNALRQPIRPDCFSDISLIKNLLEENVTKRKVGMMIKLKFTILNANKGVGYKGLY